jgi:hypothetical protein
MNGGPVPVRGCPLFLRGSKVPRDSAELHLTIFQREPPWRGHPRGKEYLW